jgi:hypothetical protein
MPKNVIIALSEGCTIETGDGRHEVLSIDSHGQIHDIFLKSEHGPEWIMRIHAVPSKECLGDLFQQASLALDVAGQSIDNLNDDVKALIKKTKKRISEKEITRRAKRAIEAFMADSEEQS